MIARPVYNKQRGGGGMTLPEIVIALAILGIVLSVCYGSSVALQRGFASTTSWADARTNQLRVLDSLAADLRNATAKSFTISADGLTNTLPLTLTIPMRYQPNPSPSPAYETTGPLAGDPARSALRVEPGVYATTGSMQYRDSSGQQVAIAVTYRYGASGTKRTIVRQIDWPYTAPATSTLALSPPLLASSLVVNVNNRRMTLSQASAWQEALAAAEAGVHQGIAQLEQGLAQNSLPLAGPSQIDWSIPFPSGTTKSK